MFVEAQRPVEVGAKPAMVKPLAGSATVAAASHADDDDDDDDDKLNIGNKSRAIKPLKASSTDIGTALVSGGKTIK